MPLEASPIATNAIWNQSNLHNERPSDSGSSCYSLATKVLSTRVLFRGFCRARLQTECGRPLRPPSHSSICTPLNSRRSLSASKNFAKFVNILFFDNNLETMVETGTSVGVAFALNCGAGFATVLGGMIIFSKRLVHLANPLSLAVALSISAGVMLFISLVEMFGKSVYLLTEGIRTPEMTEETANGHGWLGATGCFAVGIILIYAIDLVVHSFAPDTAVTELATLDNLRESFEHHQLQTSKGPVYLEAQAPGLTVQLDEAARAKLNRMGLLSALAIGIHNMPEGIATYVGAMRNSSVGASLAIGIGLHNIPEGIAVATPIYFATGSRWRGVMWCCISAAAEPLGGVIAWLVVGDGMDTISEGILLGVVCGIMVCICVKELLPTAFKFARGKHHYVTRGAFAGMFIMVTSLILFAYVGV